MSFIEKLEQRLQLPLPGLKAQSKMFPGKSRELPNVTKLANAREAAVCILLFERDKSWFTTIIKRVEYKGVHSGQMAFPGGKREGDESFIEAALRETEEEICVQVTSENVLGKLSPLYIPPSNMYVEPVLAYIDYSPKYTKQIEEVDKIIEVKIETLLDDSNRKVKTMTHSSGIKFETPYFDVQNHVVWGATAIMISEFVETIKPIFKGA